MTASYALSGQRPPDHDAVVFLHGLSWADFEEVARIRGERANPRLSFLDGELEIMSPSTYHEGAKSMIARLLESYLLDEDIDFFGYGSWLVKESEEEAG